MKNLELGTESLDPSAPTMHVQRQAHLAQEEPEATLVKKNTFSELVATEMAIYQQIEEANGEISPALDMALAQVQLDRADKLDGCKYLIDQFELRAEFLKTKEQEFRAQRKTCEAVAEKIRRCIKEGMTSLKIDEACGNEYRFKLSVSKDPKITIDESQLPSDYMQVVERYVPNRAKIEAALEAGFEISGAKYEPILTLRAYLNSNNVKRISKK